MTDFRRHVALQPPPHERFVELMAGEQQRERRERQMVAALVDVAGHVHPDRPHNEAAHHVGRGGEAHTPTVAGRAPDALRCNRCC